MNKEQLTMNNAISEIEKSLKTIAGEVKTIKKQLPAVIQAVELPDSDTDFISPMLGLKDEMEHKNDPFTRQISKIKEITEAYLKGLAKGKVIPIKQLFYLDGQGCLFYKSTTGYWLEVGETITIYDDEVYEVYEAKYNDYYPQEQRLYVKNISLKERIAKQMGQNNE